VMVEKAL